MPDMKAPPLKAASDILLRLFGGSENRLALFLLQHAYFISPQRLLAFCEEKKGFVCFPNAVRGSREHHPGRQRKEASNWKDRPVTVCDNTKARVAFARFAKLVMAGDKNDRIRGYHVAHIWERVYDPEYFTAGWNLCLMPGFLKLFTEQQDRVELLQKVIQQAAFDLYFKNAALGIAAPEYVVDPCYDLGAMFPGFTPNVLPLPIST
jgi:hypothetical protein